MNKRIGLVIVAVLLVLPISAGMAQGEDAGQIAIAGADGNIHVYDMASETFTQMTNDGTRRQKIYAWPTWATDGRLAFFGISQDFNDFYTLGIFVQDPGGDPVRAYTSTLEVFTYAYWAPCPAAPCQDLAVLYTRAEGRLGTRLIQTGDDVTITEIASGGSFYWDWSPDGSTMFWAQDGEGMAIYDVASEQVVRTFDVVPGRYRAVDWSPVDDRLLAAVANGRSASDLVVLDGDEQIVLAERVPGLVSFEWSPDGSQVAYLDDDAGRLFILDAATGAELAALPDGIVSFFWSPDGSKIAYVAFSRVEGDILAKPAAQSGDLRIEWYVYDVAQDESFRLADFLPTRDMLYYLSFFDQFSRSHRLWSPDSRYLVYGEFLDDGTEVVSLLDTEQPGLAPQTVMEGTLGVFSW
ncbi:MAG: hypothetical protein GYB65_17780 [Chloroflexi bacterium]|nr:hypothetical protein [Chloroflexota bacterium]